MTFLPVVDRELRVAARRRGTYWTRLLFAVVCAGIAGLVLMFAWAMRGGTSGAGSGLFHFLTLITLGFSAFAGVFLTADCLSQEKREGTLGLLFLTDLKGYDVMLGKLAVTSLNAFYALLAICPVLALPLLMCGVTFGEVGGVMLALVNTLVFSLAMGLFISSISWREQNAMMGAAVLLFSAGIILPA